MSHTIDDVFGKSPHVLVSTLAEFFFRFKKKVIVPAPSFFTVLVSEDELFEFLFENFIKINNLVEKNAHVFDFDPTVFHRLHIL